MTILAIYLITLVATSFFLGWLCKADRADRFNTDFVIPLIVEARKGVRHLNDENERLLRLSVLLQQKVERLTNPPREKNGRFCK